MNRRKLSSAFGLAAVAVLFGTTAIAGGHTAPAPAKDIVDTAVGAGSFTTLVAAVQAAGLVDTLKGSGPFTVWAPTDDAFAALPEGTVENLLKPENKDQLTAILLYHVVPGKTMSTQVKAWAVNGEDVATVQGSTVRATISDDVISINNATVVGVDVVASNGVIHVIDTVLLPPEA
jgi:uncharacterized surface protein with fasciclin (FAS1) repeats